MERPIMYIFFQLATYRLMLPCMSFKSAPYDICSTGEQIAHPVPTPPPPTQQFDQYNGSQT